MNVIIANKYRDVLANLDIEIIKSLDGEFSVDEIIETFRNFFFQKMIIDVTAIKDYKNISIIQKLSMAFDMDRVILLLDGSQETSNPEYLSDLISMHIYNFTMNVEGVRYLYDHPNSYRDVAQYHQLDTNHDVVYASAPTSTVSNEVTRRGTVIAFIDVTEGAGATTLTYLAKRQLGKNYKAVAIEADKHDFMYFDEKNMVSVNSSELGNAITKYSDYDAILIDANKSTSALSLASIVIYLLEPSKIKLNKLLSKEPSALSKYSGKKIVLNKCALSTQDVSDFEYETKLNVFYTLPALNDQSDENQSLDAFLAKLGFYKQSSEGTDKKNLFGRFK